jgi:hypothetical protein
VQWPTRERASGRVQQSQHIPHSSRSRSDRTGALARWCVVRHSGAEQRQPTRRPAGRAAAGCTTPAAVLVRCAGRRGTRYITRETRVSSGCCTPARGTTEAKGLRREEERRDGCAERRDSETPCAKRSARHATAFGQRMYPEVLCVAAERRPLSMSVAHTRQCTPSWGVLGESSCERPIRRAAG